MPKAKKRKRTMVEKTYIKAEEVREKRPVGRPTKYKPEYCDELIEFFDKAPTKIIKKKAFVSGVMMEIDQEVPIHPIFLCDFAKKLNVTTSTLWEWGQEHPEFSNALLRIKELQEKLYLTNGTLGHYTPYLVSLVLRNKHGYQEKVQNEISGKDGAPIEVKFI
jgi:hypothetical protein